MGEAITATESRRVFVLQTVLVPDRGRTVYALRNTVVRSSEARKRHQHLVPLYSNYFARQGWCWKAMNRITNVQIVPDNLILAVSRHTHSLVLVQRWAISYRMQYHSTPAAACGSLDMRLSTIRTNHSPIVVLIQLTSNPVFRSAQVVKGVYPSSSPPCCLIVRQQMKRASMSMSNCKQFYYWQSPSPKFLLLKATHIIWYINHQLNSFAHLPWRPGSGPNTLTYEITIWDTSCWFEGMPVDNASNNTAMCILSHWM